MLAWGAGAFQGSIRTAASAQSCGLGLAGAAVAGCADDVFAWSEDPSAWIARDETGAARARLGRLSGTTRTCTGPVTNVGTVSAPVRSISEDRWGWELRCAQGVYHFIDEVRSL